MCALSVSPAPCVCVSLSLSLSPPPPSHALRLHTLQALAAHTQHSLLPPPHLTPEEKEKYASYTTLSSPPLCSLAILS